ncbi:MAG: HAD-IIA family hydrolase [Anaerolineae bacterium]|nr:HAD-IIA family hydrolase [Anaerolineae bacterium]
MTRVAAIVLAAGASARFGSPKQLLDWGGVSLTAHTADLAHRAELAPIVVVLGHQAAAVKETLANRSVQTVVNWRWEEGLSTSVQVGLSALPPDVDGAIFLHCDQPLVTVGLLRQLVARFEQTQAPIVLPAFQGQRATPVLFARRLFHELAAAHGDQGGRQLINDYANEVARVDVNDPFLLTDADTPDIYARLQSANLQSANLQSPPPNLIVDMDGVLWRGDEALPGFLAFFDFLRRHRICFTLATNNASRRPDQYVQKLARLGAEVSADHILTSAQATAAYLSTIAPPTTPVYVIGEDGLRDALTERDFTLVERDARYVAVGFTRHLSWEMLARATIEIRAGAQFFGANPDVTFPSEDGPVPGNGATLAALEAATGVAPTVIGKPAPWLYQEAMQRMNASPETTLVIGDRLDTDIAGGIRAGIRTVLLLSGIATRDQLATSPFQPDAVFDTIGALVQAWEATPPKAHEEL